MPYFWSITKRLSESFRSKGDVAGLLALPLFITLLFALGYFVYPELSPKAQDAIDNRAPGVIFAMIGGLLLWSAFVASWQSAVALYRGERS